MKRHYVAGVRIAGVACAVPKRVVKCEGRSAKVVGVEERRFAESDRSLIDLGAAAAKRLMTDLGWQPDTVGALVFVTQTNWRRMPSISCELHAQLGLPNNVPAFDLNMACSGYVYGLWVAASLRLPRVVLVVGDTISRFLDPDDASTYPIFGDAVSATGLELTGQLGGIEFIGGTDGNGAESLYCTDKLHMDGLQVFNFALSIVPTMINNVTMSSHVDFHFFHQANKFLLDAITTKARIAQDKVPTNMSRYGNTSSSSIPLLFCDSDATEHLRSRKCRVALYGFGGGLSWGGILTEIDRLSCSLVEM